MRIVSRIIALSRAIQLNRQFREVEKAIDAMPLASRRQLAAIAMREFSSASRSEFPHLHGTDDNTQRYQPWGNGTDLGYARMKSDNSHLQLRGIALWLTVAYHETKESKYGEVQSLHRHVMRTLRLLKQHAPQARTEDWSARPAPAGQAA